MLFVLASGSSRSVHFLGAAWSNNVHTLSVSEKRSPHTARSQYRHHAQHTQRAQHALYSQKRTLEVHADRRRSSASCFVVDLGALVFRMPSKKCVSHVGGVRDERANLFALCHRGKIVESTSRSCVPVLSVLVFLIFVLPSQQFWSKFGRETIVRAHLSPALDVSNSGDALQLASSSPDRRVACAL